MIRLQNLRKMRIVDSHQRAPLQLCEVIGQPERNQRDGNSAVFKYSPAKVQVPACISKIRLNQPEHIPATRKDHPAAHYDQSFAIPLQVARKQQGKGNQPVEDKVQRDDVSHPPRKRSRYQGISSGRLPLQMMRNWEKAR